MGLKKRRNESIQVSLIVECAYEDCPHRAIANKCQECLVISHWIQRQLGRETFVSTSSKNRN